MCYAPDMSVKPPDTSSAPTKSSLSWGMFLVLAGQHVVVLFSGILLIPVMLANIHGFDQGDSHYLVFATALCAAAATLLQLVRGKRFGLGAPMFMGTSGAFMGCAHSAVGLGGPALLAGMVLVAAPFQVLFSYCIRFMRHILTPTVGGVVIMLAMVGLLKDSVKTWAIKGNGTGMAAALDIATGIATMVVMLGVEWFGGKRLRPWALPLGMLAGGVISLLDGLMVIPNLSQTPWIGLPAGDWPGLAFSVGDLGHWTLVFTFVLAVLATSIKYTGDAMILQRVANPIARKVNYDALQGGLYANSLGMMLAGLFGGMPSSSHSSNIPLMEMTGVATRRVAAAASLLLAFVAFSPKALLLIVNLPEPVVGGVGVVLVAHLFSSGMQLVASEMNHRNGIIAGLSLCVGLIAASGNFFPDAFPVFLAPLIHNGVALGGLVAVVLTLITHLGTHRGVRIAIKPVMEQLSPFKVELGQAAARLQLDIRSAGYLELACEELFLYMREEYKAKNYTGHASFMLRRDDDSVMVEVAGGTRFQSEADEITAREIHCPEAMGSEKLNALGLALLGRIASDVSHVTIAGYTYIRFSLPVGSD